MIDTVEYYKKVLKEYPYIWIDEERLSGVPCITGTRLPVSLVLTHLAQGATSEEIQMEFPGYDPRSLPDILAFTAEVMNGFWYRHRLDLKWREDQEKEANAQSSKENQSGDGANEGRG